MINKESKIYIAGHNGMVGSACKRLLLKSGYVNIIGKSSKDLDLRNQNDVKDYLVQENPSVIIDAAAKVGGILANDTYPYEFLMDNMLIQNNLISSAIEMHIPNFIFLGSSCIYPKYAPQPINEEHLLTSSLESTNEWYAIAKISGLKLIESVRKQFGKNYVSLMPTNLYGPGDNYDLYTSHVIPALLRKFHEAKENNHSTVKLWGSGKPKREFLHVDDLAQAILFSIENKLEDSFYNVGSGEDLSIMELALMIQRIVNHKGSITWDLKKPDGTPRKLMDSSKFKSKGWKNKINLKDGITEVYNQYQNSL